MLAWILTSCAARPTAEPAVEPPPFQATTNGGEVEDEFEAENERLRLTVRPALEAFDSKNVEALASWTETPSRRPAHRALGALLLHRIGSPSGWALFLETLPTSDSDEFSELSDLRIALMKRIRFDPQVELICAGLTGDRAAIRKLLELQRISDGGMTTDNHCGQAVLAANRPDDMLPEVLQFGGTDELVHSFVEEASPTLAQKLLGRLEASPFNDPALDALRERLLPALRAKAKAEHPSDCAWWTCQ